MLSRNIKKKKDQYHHNRVFASDFLSTNIVMPAAGFLVFLELKNVIYKTFVKRLPLTMILGANELTRTLDRFF